MMKSADVVEGRAASLKPASQRVFNETALRENLAAVLSFPRSSLCAVFLREASPYGTFNAFFQNFQIRLLFPAFYSLQTFFCRSLGRRSNYSFQKKPAFMSKVPEKGFVNICCETMVQCNKLQVKTLNLYTLKWHSSNLDSLALVYCTNCTCFLPRLFNFSCIEVYFASCKRPGSSHQKLFAGAIPCWGR